MITASNKLWATAGAFALAATAVLVPVAAQAEEPGDTETSATADAAEVGSAAGRSAARTNRGAANRAAANAGANTPPESVVSGVTEAAAPGVASGARATSPGAQAFGNNPLFQNPLWWFGTPNPAPPPSIASRNFDALASLPGWARSYYGWYEDLNFEACVLGLSSTTSPNLGPYGNSTGSVSTGGC